MLKNNKGNFLIDAIIALTLIAWLIVLCERALHLLVVIQRTTEKEGFYDTLPELFEEATRFYDD